MRTSFEWSESFLQAARFWHTLCYHCRSTGRRWWSQAREESQVTYQYDKSISAFVAKFFRRQYIFTCGIQDFYRTCSRSTNHSFDCSWSILALCFDLTRASKNQIHNCGEKLQQRKKIFGPIESRLSVSEDLQELITRTAFLSPTFYFLRQRWQLPARGPPVAAACSVALGTIGEKSSNLKYRTYHSKCWCWGKPEPRLGFHFR